MPNQCKGKTGTVKIATLYSERKGNFVAFFVNDRPSVVPTGGVIPRIENYHRDSAQWSTRVTAGQHNSRVNTYISHASEIPTPLTG
jgi:hypothetical protein